LFKACLASLSVPEVSAGVKAAAAKAIENAIKAKNEGMATYEK
jgi:hypothetical protein